MSRSSTRLHYGWIVLGAATLVVFGSLGLGRFGYSAVLPAMQKGLGMDNAAAGALATANLVGYLLLAVIGGALASRFGPRAVVAAGLAVAGAGMLLTGMVNGFAGAAVCRGLTGMGSGASNVPVMALLSAWFAPRRRGMAAGIGVAGSSLALIVVGLLVPPVLSAFGPDGWRACWVLFGGVTMALALAAWLLLRNDPRDKGLAPVEGSAPDNTPGSGGAGLRWGTVYRAGVVWHLGLVYVAFGFSYIIYMTFFVKRLIAEGGYSPQAAGHLFMVMGWFSLLCGLIWGTVSDRIGRKRALVIVYLIHAAAFSLFAVSAGHGGLLLSAVLFGLSAWSIPAIMAATCGDVLGPRLAPAALGFITLFFGVGQAVGPSVAGVMADASGSFRSAFLLAAAVALAGGAGAALLKGAGTGSSPSSAPPGLGRRVGCPRGRQ